MTRLYVFKSATRVCVAVFACDANDKGDAAAGCEHAAGDQHYTDEFSWSFSAEDLQGADECPVKQVPPLSLAPARPESTERKRLDLLAQLAVLDATK